MSAACRIFDNETGGCDVGAKCCGHSRTGTGTVGSPNVYINNLAAHRQEDTGPCNCSHGGTFKSIKGSSNVFVNGQPLTRVGDDTSCMSCSQPGTHINGSPDVWVNGR